MRKIFFATLAALLLTLNTAAAQTDYNFVPVTDFGPQAFIERMVASPRYQQLVQNGVVLAFVSPVRRADLDDTQNFPGLSVYKSDFGVKGAPNSDGQIRFYVDAQGSVYSIQVINENAGAANVSTMVLIMTLEALGLNEQEGNVLLQTPGPRAETWCAAANRRILRMVTDGVGNVVFLFGASN